ncbi:MAG: hypothetical protein U9Q74_02965 [Gemmatimonadota bacterium]|nr:hypothetical protein [Gemmatimonadota bacterium]
MAPPTRITASATFTALTTFAAPTASAVLAAALLAAALIAASPGAAFARQGGRTARPPAAAAETALTIGTYVSSRLDGKKLPVKDLADDDHGTQFLIEFDELVLAFRANGEFRATLRYRQTLAPKGVPTSQEPLQRMVVYGAWSRAGRELRFVPDPKRGGEGLTILNGTFTGRTVTVPFDYRNAGVARRATVLLLYDPSII